MKVYGDIESVNLKTGERHRRVAGNGESRLESLGIPGLKKVNPVLLAEYEEAMRVREAIPEILRAIRNRERLAHESRQQWLGG